MNEFFPYRNNRLRILAAYLLFALVFAILVPNIYGLDLEGFEVIFEKASHDSLYSFGISIACAGDVNGDGYDDIIIAADSAGPCPGTPDSSYVGKAYLFYGGSPMDTISDLTFTQGFKGDFSIDVSSAGDINADDFDDVLMGVQSADGWGKVYIFFGGLEPDTVPGMILSGEGLGAFPFGCSVSHVGDVNGDGWDDFAVGAYFGDGGRVYVYFGGPGFDDNPDVVLGALQPAENFGLQVGGGGDMNGDGFDDVVVGAEFNCELWIGNGKVYGFFGGDPMDTIPDVWIYGEGPWQCLGLSDVTCSGDLQGDGFDDLLVGNAMYPYGVRPGPGKLYLLFGGNPMDTVVDLWMIGRKDTAGLGTSSALVRKPTTEPYSAIVSGAPQDYDYQVTTGKAYFWLGGSAMDTTPDAYLAGDYGCDNMGFAVASAGDVDGDGLEEILVSNYVCYVSPPKVWVLKYGKVTNFSAVAGDGFVRLTWDGAYHEGRVMGYNLYRSEHRDTSSWLKLNPELITPGYGSHSWIDREVSNGVTYFYWVHALGSSTPSELFGPVSATPTALIISSFTAEEGQANYVRLRWHTEQEPDFPGWNVYRSERHSLPSPEDRRNEQLISPAGPDYFWVDWGTEDGVTYYYWLGDVNLLEEERYFGPIELTTICFALHQNYPNPFSSTTTIRFSIPGKTRARLKIYDIAGRLVRTLLDEGRTRGRYEVQWDGTDRVGKKVPNGVYFCRLKAGENTATRKMVVLK